MQVLKIIALIGFFATGSAHAAYQTVFTLERTLNNNRVVYEADLSNQEVPIHVYWIKNTDRGQREELTRLERSRAYGVQVLRQSAHEVTFYIKAFRKGVITIKEDPSTNLPYAMMTLSSGPKILKSIYLHLTNGIIPGVKTIDVFYQSEATGPILKEGIDPSKN